jgi:predicted transcriptional regulator
MADLIVTAANVIAVSNAVKGTGIAGETITAGQSVYLKSADGRIWKAKSSGTVEESTLAGIALHAALAGQPIQYAAGGGLNIGATTVKTSAYMVSATAGGICPQADLVSTNKIAYAGYATDVAGAFVIMNVPTGAVV